MSEQPHWEHGHRCHGYWLGDRRIGFVGLPPFNVGEIGYGWSMDFPRENTAAGRMKSLRSAKRAVERAYLSQPKGTT